MNKKDELNNYFKIMYDFYEKNNFKFFLEKCMNYNIKIGDFGKDIDFLSRKVFTSVLNAMPQESIKFEYKNYINYYYLNVFNLQNNKVKYNIIVDVPVFEDNYERIALKCLKFLVDNKINFSMKFYKKLKNSFFKICFEDLSQLKMFVNYFGKGEEFISETKSRVLPFLNSINLLGIYTEIYPFSFKNYFIFQLYLYFNHCDINNIVDRISLDDFHSYIRNKLKIEKRDNKKRMYNILFNYLDIMLYDKDLYLLFNENSVMNISSYMPNDYILKMDNKKMIYFIDKVEGIEIKYGSVDFLNVAYSKYYDNVIKKEENDKYYNDFYSIYSNILCSNFKNMDGILLLLNPKMDNINKLLVVFSSAYFAYKKFDLSIQTIYYILDYVVPLVFSYDFNNNFVNKKNNEYVLNEEYANTVINLKDGTKSTVKEYYKIFNVLANINNDSVVKFKNGESYSGKQFLDKLIKYVSNYDNYKELCDDLVLSIE